VVPLKRHELYTRHVFPMFSTPDFPDEARVERMVDVARHWVELCAADPTFEVSDLITALSHLSSLALYIRPSVCHSQPLR
jgi:hypothetical protein